MHEHHITNEVVHQILHACEDEGIISPKKIVVSLGLLSGYKKEPVLYYFEGHKNSIKTLKDATLEIIEIEGKIYCNNCKKENQVDYQPIILCPNCNSSNVKVLEGKEIAIIEISII